MDPFAGARRAYSTSFTEPAADHTAELGKGVKGMRLGLPKEYFIEGLDTQVEQRVREAVHHFEKLGAKVIDINLPHTEHALSTYYLIAPDEASANLARFHGLRF